MQKVGHLSFSTISRCTICEGNINKVSHLRFRQFQGIPFAWETCKKRATWGFDNFKMYHLLGKHGKSLILEGSTIFRRTIREGNMDKVGYLRVRQFEGVPFARETLKKWATWGFDNFKSYHLRGKHGKSGLLEGSTIFKHTICDWNMQKSGQIESLTILRRTICEGNMEKVGHLTVRQI